MSRELLGMRRVTERWSVGVEWKIQDSWVGVFWQWRLDLHPRLQYLHIWICLVPWFPIHFCYEGLAPGLQDWDIQEVEC